MMTTNRTLHSIDLDALLETVIDGRTEEEEEEEEEYSYRLWSSDSEGLVDDPQEVASYEVTGLSREELIHRSPHIEYWAPSVGRHHTLSPIYESRDVSSRYGRSVCIIAQPRETLDDEEGGRREPLIKDGVGGGRGEALSAEGRGGGKSESLIKEGGGGGGGTRGHLPPSYTETQRNILTGRTKRCCGVNCGACEHRAETDNTNANTQHTTKPPDRSPFTPRGGDTDTYPAVPGERTSKDVVTLREEMATKAEIGPHDYLSDGRWTASKDALGVSGYPSKYPVPRQAISRIDQEAPPISGRNSNNLPSPRRASVPDDSAVSSPREVKSSPAGRADGGAPCRRIKEGEPVEDFEFVDAPRLYTPPPEYTSAGGVTEVAAAVSPCDDEAGMRRAVAAKAAASPARAEVRSLVVRDRASDDPDPTDRTSSKTKAEANRAAAAKTSSSAKTNGVRDDVEIIIDFVPADGDNAPPDKGYRFQRAKELTRVLSSPASSGAVVTKALAKTLPGDIPHCAGKVRTLASQYEDEDKRSKEVSAMQPETAATARDAVVQTRDAASAATRDNVAATRDAMVTRDSEAATRYSAAVTRDAMMIRNTPAATHDSTAATRHSEAASGVATPLDVIPVKAGGEIADRLFQEMRAYEKVRAAREHADPPRRDPAVTQEVPLSEKAISRMTANEKMRAVQAIITSHEATPEPRGDDLDPTPPHPSRSLERVVQSERDYEELEVTSSYVGDEVAGETRDGSCRLPPRDDDDARKPCADVSSPVRILGNPSAPPPRNYVAVSRRLMSLPQFELTRTKFEDVGVDSGESGKSPGSGTRSREESVGGNSPAAPVSTVGSGNSSASYGAGVYDMFDGSADDDGDGKPTVSTPNRQDISTKASRPEAVLNEGEDKACHVGVSRTQKTPSPCREEAVYSVVDKSSKQTRIAPLAEGSHDPTITPAAATSRTRSDSASDTELPDDQRLPSNDYQEIDFKPAAIPRSDPATVIDQLEESCVDPGREGTWSEAMSSPDTASVYTQDESIEVIPQQGVDWVSADIHHDSRGATSSSSSIDSGHDSHQTGHFVVVAIDFGTTYSGYAFSFTKDADSIHMMRKWEGGDPGIVNQKTPTTVLLTPEGKFHSFGYAARDFFHDLDPKEAAQWLYFEKFKMALHHSMTLSRDTELAASNRKKVPAIHVFSCALRYFRDHALQELTDQSATKILNEDVRWVITVPAIWKQPAKQFMRHAAYEAGIASAQYPDQLLIALEPEAASIYCRKLRVHQLMPVTPPVMRLSPRAVEGSPAESAESVDDNVSEDSSSAELFLSKNELVEDDIKAGTRYILVDCGGGTVDLTVHEMGRKHAHLKELYKATGGPHGSVGVDIAFLKLLNDIFGVECMNQFREKRPASFVDLMIAFESRKRNTSPFKDNPLNVSLPFSFIDFYKKAKGHHIEAAIRKYGDKDVSWSSQGMLRLMPSAMKRLFQPTVDHIKQHVGDALNNPSIRDITYLFLVGGFAESLILQQEVRKAFGHILKVIIPQDVSLSILKGAVLFGLDPTVVNVRRCRFTYGVGVLNRFDPAKHPENKRVVKDGVTWCADIFDKFVVTGQSVGIGDVVMRKYAPARCNQSTSVIHIYSSETEDPQFLSDPGTHHCGTLTLDLSSTASHTFRHEIQVRMTFGDTEIKVNAVNMATGKTVKSSIDFLCN